MALKEEKEFAISGQQKVSVRGETNAVSGMRVMIVQNRHQKPLHPLSHQHQEAEVRREKGASEAGVRLGRPTDRNNQRPKKGGDERAVAIMKSVRQLSCVSQDTEPPESARISRKGTKVLGAIRRVRFTRAALRQANIRESKGPSLATVRDSTK